ncbi:MAG: hypothetical protein HY730_05615 [Candidatus Tectomicrobia bacterium]|uniref:Uncharacterized protein n=1 Tax=Tectimicrobiota bacterium TaxID=2528274 RepID=A0A933GLK9_UNCTE|nr:hypothetical protein [Candidatus Tectomicrobia bacterium]
MNTDYLLLYYYEQRTCQNPGASLLEEDSLSNAGQEEVWSPSGRGFLILPTDQNLATPRFGPTC